jgi:hypothetical protein
MRETLSAVPHTSSLRAALPYVLVSHHVAKSSILERQGQFKLASLKKLRADYIRGMIDTIQFRICCISSCVKT